MTGPSNACNPEPGIWLALQPETSPDQRPAWLSESERVTLAGLGAARQQEYLHSRWLLRQALSLVSGVAAEHCKPVVGRPTASLYPAGWQLSLSHSHQLAACATGTRAVGVDIEPLSRRSDWQRIVRRWFTRQEQDWLLAADDKKATTQFLAVWTLKEAWLKATGRGIANNLQTLEVSADLQLRGDAVEPGWHAAVGITEGFMIALVYRADRQRPPQCHWLAPSSHSNPAIAVASVRPAQIDWLALTTIHTATTINTGA